jgi:hypothetical protein
LETQLKSSFRYRKGILQVRNSSEFARRAGLFATTIRLVSLAVPLLVAVGGPVGAQLPAEQASRCYGFAFGAWTPPLDWRAAGHGPFPAAGSDQRAPDGRSWAFDPAADTLLILVPSWWPAGVVVSLPNPPGPGGDTVVTRATALVANGERRPPVSRVRVWAVSCR